MKCAAYFSVMKYVDVVISLSNKDELYSQKPVENPGNLYIIYILYLLIHKSCCFTVLSNSQLRSPLNNYGVSHNIWQSGIILKGNQFYG